MVLAAGSSGVVRVGKTPLVRSTRHAYPRFARRFAWPTLVFNSHHQFDRLREEGRYARMQEVIRSREVRLQGTLNPNLADFGVRSEARQYAGRPAEEGWRCPFHAGGGQKHSNEEDVQ